MIDGWDTHVGQSKVKDRQIRKTQKETYMYIGKYRRVHIPSAKNEEFDR